MTTNDTNEEGKRVKAVQRAFAVVETLRGANSMQIAEVAEALDLPPSTAHVHLKTLESVGYAVKDEDGYRLSFRFLRDGITIRERRRVYRVAQSEMDKLATETNEVASLGIEENGLRVIIHQSEGNEAVYDNAPVGEYTNIHCTALGKAILAECSPEYIDWVIETHGLPKKTDQTLSKPDELLAELQRIETQGYAIEDEERRIGIRSVAVPIIVDGSVVGSVSLSGPKERFSSQYIQEELLPKIRNAANVIEVKYTYD